MSVQGVDLQMWTLTSILHVKLGKYELSELKSFILIWGCFGGISGVSHGITSDMTLQCLLTVYYSNYSEIKENSHLFLQNPKWLPNTSHNISHNAFVGDRSASWSPYMSCDNRNLKLPFLATRCQTQGVDLPLDLPMWTLTSILHVKLGKYELSELKSFILIWGVFCSFFRGVGGVKGVLHPTWLYNAIWLFTTQIIQI